MAPLLEFDNITKSFHGVPVLRGITAAVEPGSITGLAGGNGAGKSTLMNLVWGSLQPDGGSMRLQGKSYVPRHPAEAEAAGIAFVQQELNVFPNLTIAENLLLTHLPRRGFLINRSTLMRQAEELLSRVGLNISPRLLLERLSPGERQLVEIAKALRGAPRLIILDEPTTSLSPPECQRLFDLVRRFREEGCAFIFISHALGDMLKLCDRLLVLRDGLVAAEGAVSEFTPTSLVTHMAGREVTQLFPQKAPVCPSTQPLLEVKGLNRPKVAHDISFTLHRGEILGLAGLMGAGRTEVARMIFGLDRYAAGEVRMEGQLLTGGPRERIRAGLALLTESRSEDGICAEASIADNIALTTLPRYTYKGWGWLSQTRLKAAAEEAGTSVRLKAAAGIQQAIRRLSGGNQQKAVLARWLLTQPRVLILDEPTRGIDAAAKFEIYQLILQMAQKGTGVLLISSEEEELTALCDRILVLSRGRLAGEFAGPPYDHEALLRASFRYHETAAEPIT